MCGAYVFDIVSFVKNEESSWPHILYNFRYCLRYEDTMLNLG